MTHTSIQIESDPYTPDYPSPHIKQHDTGVLITKEHHSKMTKKNKRNSESSQDKKNEAVVRKVRSKKRGQQRKSPKKAMQRKHKIPSYAKVAMQNLEAKNLVTFCPPNPVVNSADAASTCQPNIRDIAAATLIQALFNSGGDYPLNIYPKQLLVYLYWAFFNAARDLGALDVTPDYSAMPIFPATANIPAPIVFLIQNYFMSHALGIKFKRTATYDVGSWTIGARYVLSGTGNFESSFGTIRSFLSPVGQEQKLTTDATALNFADVTSNVDQISAWWKGACRCAPYSQVITPEFLDSNGLNGVHGQGVSNAGIIYSVLPLDKRALETISYCVVDGANNIQPLGLPNQVPYYNRPTFVSGATMILCFADVVSQESRKGGVRLDWRRAVKDTPWGQLSSLSIVTQQGDLRQYNHIVSAVVSATLDNWVNSLAAPPTQDQYVSMAYALLVYFESALFVSTRRFAWTASFSAPLFTNTNDYAADALCAASWLGVKLPPVIAKSLHQFRPTVYGRKLLVTNMCYNSVTNAWGVLANDGNLRSATVQTSGDTACMWELPMTGTTASAAPMTINNTQITSGFLAYSAGDRLPSVPYMTAPRFFAHVNTLPENATSNWINFDIPMSGTVAQHTVVTYTGTNQIWNGLSGWITATFGLKQTVAMSRMPLDAFLAGICFTYSARSISNAAVIGISTAPFVLNYPSGGNIVDAIVNYSASGNSEYSDNYQATLTALESTKTKDLHSSDLRMMVTQIVLADEFAKPFKSLLACNLGQERVVGFSMSYLMKTGTACYPFMVTSSIQDVTEYHSLSTFQSWLKKIENGVAIGAHILSYGNKLFPVLGEILAAFA